MRLSDINADVIGCYRTIRDAVEDVISALWRLDEGHRTGGREHFYEVRNHRFNPARRAVSRTSNFTSYTAARFSAEEQGSLQRRVIELASRGAHVLLSNSFAPDISALYENTAAKRAGLLTRTVQARRAINSRASSRGPVLEYLITNVPEGV